MSEQLISPDANNSQTKPTQITVFVGNGIQKDYVKVGYKRSCLG
jgi:hypothetical protein